MKFHFVMRFEAAVFFFEAVFLGEDALLLDAAFLLLAVLGVEAIFFAPFFAVARVAFRFLGVAMTLFFFDATILLVAFFLVVDLGIFDVLGCLPKTWCLRR